MEYIEELYAKDEKPDTVPLEQDEEMEAGRLGPDILKEENEKAMQQLKNGKSQGVDVIPVEMIKAMGLERMNAFVKLFSNIYKTRGLAEVKTCTHREKTTDCKVQSAQYHQTSCLCFESSSPCPN